MKNSNKGGFWYAFNLTAIILIFFFVFAVPFIHAFVQFTQSVDIKATQKEQSFLYAPTTFTVDISNVNATPLNAVEFELHYDPKAVLVTAIVPTTTLCEDRFIISNTINNASGTALFQCGTVTPYSGTNGSVATVHIIPLTSGTSSITFGTQTHVLAHDGLGTDATKDIQSIVLTTI